MQAVARDGVHKACGGIEGILADLHAVIQRCGLAAVRPFDRLRTRVEDKDLRYVRGRVKADFILRFPKLDLLL